MKIIDIKVNPMTGYSTWPRIYVQFDGDLPDNLVYTFRNEIVRAQVGDYIKFHSVCDIRHGGYGGTPFNFDLVNGDRLENVGAWSSNSPHVNSIFPELDPAMEAASNNCACNVNALAVAKWFRENDSRYQIAVLETIIGLHHQVLIDGKQKCSEEKILEIL